MALAPLTPAQAARSQGKLKAAEFLALVTGYGYPAMWEKAMACPIRVASVANHDLSCPLCSGRRFVYYGSEEIRVYLSSLSLREMWQEMGRFDLGTAMVTTTPNTRLGVFDKITLTQSRMKYTEPIHCSGATDKFRYPPLSIERIVTDRNLECVEGSDFTRNAAGIEWNTGSARYPGPGRFYSVLYFYRPVYLVIDLVHAFRDSPLNASEQQEMPVQSVARLDYLVPTPEPT